MFDRNLNANVYDPSVDSAPALPASAYQRYAASPVQSQRGYGWGQGMNPLLQALGLYLGGGSQMAQPDPAAQQANAWGNQMGITPQNQWDNRWKLLNSTSPLGQAGRDSLRQDYGGANYEPSAGPYLGTEAQKPKSSGTNWDSFPAGGGGLVYSGSQVPSYERGDVKNVDPLYDFYARNQDAMAGYW